MVFRRVVLMVATILHSAIPNGNAFGWFTFGMLQPVCRNSGKSPGFVGIGGIPLHLGQRKKLTSTVTNGLRLRGGEDSSQLYCFT